VYGNLAGHEQIAYAMKKATDDGTQNITIRLRPHQLGLVDIQMTVSADGKIQAVLAADKPETLFWLQQDAKQLERSLQDSGLKTDSTSLSFQFRGDSGTGGYSSNQNSRNEHQNAPIEARQREVNNPSAETADQPERSGVSTRPGALNMRV
jgi:flagellar hook-length control protein FliK